MTRDILVVGSDLKIFHNIYKHFQDGLTNVYHADSVEEALLKLQINKYSLIISDLSRQAGNADNVVAMLRKQNPIPILALLESGSDLEMISALESGADAAVKKTIDIKILFAQMNALLRRYTELNHLSQICDDILCYDDLLLDSGRRVVLIGGKEIPLPHKEYEILLYMLKNRWRALTYEQIYETVWKEIFLGDKSVVFYHMGQLRRLLGNGWIESVRGVGYRLCDRMKK